MCIRDSNVYPKRDVAELYAGRWQIETNLRHLKTTMGMDVLRCETVDGIHREVAMFGVVYNAVRLVMTHIAQMEDKPPDHISFIDVLRWLALGCRGSQLPKFIVNPRRSRSPAPRIVRRRHKGHTYMTRPRRPQKSLDDKGLLVI